MDNAKLKELKVNNSVLGYRVDALQMENAELKADISKLSKDNAELKAKISKLSEDIKDLPGFVEFIRDNDMPSIKARVLNIETCLAAQGISDGTGREPSIWRVRERLEKLENKCGPFIEMVARIGREMNVPRK